MRYTVCPRHKRKAGGSFMKKVKSLLQLEYFRRQKYLREDSEEIALANLKLLMGSSIAALSLLVLFLFLTPFIIKGWKITPSHIGFLPAAIALCLISFYHYRKGRVSVKKALFSVFYLKRLSSLS